MSKKQSELLYVVIVPYRRNGKVKAVSYPGRGAKNYTRDEAVAVLEKLHNSWENIPDELMPYAESVNDIALGVNGERFHLEDA